MTRQLYKEIILSTIEKLSNRQQVYSQDFHLYYKFIQFQLEIFKMTKQDTLRPIQNALTFKSSNFVLIMSLDNVFICSLRLLQLLDQMISDQLDSITRLEAIAGIINGMIGSIAFILPTLVRQVNNIISTTIIIVISGLAMAFSSWIYSLHLGDQPDNGHSLNKHFNTKFWPKFCYDLLVWLFIVCLCIEYFQLIVTIEYLILEQFCHKTSYYYISSAVNGIVLLSFVLILKWKKFGAKTMIYGLISILSYMGFLGYYYFRLHDSQTSLEEPQNLSSQDTNYFDKLTALTASISQAFMIQVFLIPFLKKLKNQQRQRQNFMKYTAISYFIGGCVYYYIALLGSQAIQNQDSCTFPDGFGILTYFSKDGVLTAICIIYILHIYSVFPQYILISKRIFMQNIEKCQPQQQSKRFAQFEKIAQNVYLPLIIAISALIASLNATDTIAPLMILNGGVLGCLITFIIPVILHLYCMHCLPDTRRKPYSTTSSARSNKQKKNEEEISQPLLNPQTPSSGVVKIEEQSNIQMENYYCECKCQHHQKSTAFKIFMSVFLIVFAALGIFVSVQSILISGKLNQNNTCPNKVFCQS